MIGLVDRLAGKSRLARKIYEHLLVFLFLSLILVTLIRIYARHVPRDSIFSLGPLLWTEEIAESLLIFVIFLGIPIAHFHGRQITIDIVEGFLGMTKPYELLLNVAAVTFTTLAAYFGIQRAIRDLGHQLQVAPVVTYGHLYGAIGVGFAIVSVLIFYRIGTLAADVYRTARSDDGGGT